MHRLVLRWTLWFALLAIGALFAVGGARFLVPPDEKLTFVPIERLYEVASLAKDASEMERRAYEPGKPPALSQPIAYKQGVVKRVTRGRVNAGSVSDFPVPSVTYLRNLRVYLIRSDLGFTALVDDEPHLGGPTSWDIKGQRFVSPRYGEVYTWLGHCVQGPCSRDLDRFAVRVDGDDVIVDATVRYMYRIDW